MFNLCLCYDGNRLKIIEEVVNAAKTQNQENVISIVGYKENEQKYIDTLKNLHDKKNSPRLCNDQLYEIDEELFGN